MKYKESIFLLFSESKKFFFKKLLYFVLSGQTKTEICPAQEKVSLGQTGPRHQTGWPVSMPYVAVDSRQT